MQPLSLPSIARFAIGAAMAQLQDADLIVTAPQAMAHSSCTGCAVFRRKPVRRGLIGSRAKEAWRRPFCLVRLVVVRGAPERGIAGFF